jgi:hypothetical protein
MHLFASPNLELAASRYESWEELNVDDPIHDKLEVSPGKQLVFVRYFPQHGAQEWIRNAANIDAARIVWALDLGPEEDAKLRAYYPDRNIWLLEPDARPPRLSLQNNAPEGASPVLQK